MGKLKLWFSAMLVQQSITIQSFLPLLYEVSIGQ